MIGLVAAAVCCLATASCHKSCTCQAYDGSLREYTPEEVDAHGGSCAGMIELAGARHYSVCNWD